MQNPWLNLPDSSPHVLPSDRCQVEEFNSRLPESSRCRIHIDGVVPEPFVGRVDTAPVVILQLNPGSDATNVAAHSVPEFRAALLANLRHEETEWPFYFFHPRFRRSQPGGKWWIEKTRRLAEVVPIQSLSHRLAAVEWFPYKSARFRRGCIVPSQAYGFSLVNNAIERGALIVVSRSVSLWENSVPALRRYPRKLTLSSVQNVALTPNNLMIHGEKGPHCWELLLEALSNTDSVSSDEC